MERFERDERLWFPRAFSSMAHPARAALPDDAYRKTRTFIDDESPPLKARE
jgi:hypothetical protein